MAAAAIDAYAEASLLTGQATSPSVEELARRALKIKQERSRLFVFWECGESECHAVGPHTRCSCGHSYSSHAWYETSTKKVRCRVDGCKCSCFSYVPGQGSTRIRCACKHSLEDHRKADGTLGACSKCTDCKGFHSDWRCGTCARTYDEHRVTFMTAAERTAAGRPVEENLGGWSQEKPHLDAVCGGVTRMTSLLSGAERAGIPLLQHTDGAGACAVSAVGCQPCAASSTAEIFSNYDRRADSHVARLRQLRDAPADRGPGRRVGSSEPAAAIVQAPAPPPPGAGRGTGRGGGGAAAAARGRGVARGRGSEARGAGTTGAVVSSGRAPSARERRELAAAAAEARLSAVNGAAAAADAAAAPPTAVPAAPPAAPTAVAPRPPAQPRAARPSGGPSAAGAAQHRPTPRAARPAGAAKAATLAVKRERAAAAAEARMDGAREQEAA